MYPASFFFKVPSSAFVGLSCLNVFLGIVSTISTYIIELMGDEVRSHKFESCFTACLKYFLSLAKQKLTDLKMLLQDEELVYINSVLTKVFLILPHYCLGRGLIDMAANQLVTDAFAALGMCNA